MIVHQLPKELADRAAELADILAPDGSITAAAAVRDLCRECYAAGRAEADREMLAGELAEAQAELKACKAVLDDVRRAWQAEHP